MEGAEIAKELQLNRGGKMGDVCTIMVTWDHKKEVLTYFGNGEGRQGLFPKEDRSKLNLKDMSNYTGQEDIGR